ncbi:CRISPR system Cascade subunit CasC [Actinopolyspora lacussalsi]|nr:CRISPR system Cascade subunit CasC [Actinopolyspora lacussalsi]
MSTPKYAEIHALQTLPYSNPNRDDLGSPKTVEFGGSERTRISSQSWKRAIRLDVERELGEHNVRTRRVVAGVAERLQRRGWAQDEAEAAGIQVAKSAGGGIKLQNDKNDLDEVVLTTSVLLLLPESGIDELADIAAEHRDDILAEAAKVKKRFDMKPRIPSEPIEEVLKRRSGTINLFGRMLAELPGANVDGAVQLAHAFTTHGTSVEYDFFSAVDDVEKQLNVPGSGHIENAQFSAGTFYRYANVNLPDLADNLGSEPAMCADLLRAFCHSFIHSVPSGKQNSTAAVTAPDLVYLTVRDDRPVSLASAFEAPVRASDGFLAPSVERLHEHSRGLLPLLGERHVLFAGHAATPIAAKDSEEWPAFGTRHTSYDGLVDALVTASTAHEEARP